MSSLKGNLNNNLKFRKELQNISDNYATLSSVGKQIELIQKLSGKYADPIIIIEQEFPGKRSSPNKKYEYNYNCYTYALDMVNAPEIVQDISMFPDSKFVLFLIDKDTLKSIKWEDKKDGDIVIYFKDRVPAHAGKIYGERVKSKWGPAHLWEHSIFGIPIKYGNEFKVFSRIERGSSINSFIEYAKLKGVNISRKIL